MIRMTAILGIVFAMLISVGCRRINRTSAPIPDGMKIQVVELESGVVYIVDPRIESCFLRYFSSMERIDCQKLRENVPSAARFITWGDQRATGAATSVLDAESPTSSASDEK